MEIQLKYGGDYSKNIYTVLLFSLNTILSLSEALELLADKADMQF